MEIKGTVLDIGGTKTRLAVVINDQVVNRWIYSTNPIDPIATLKPVVEHLQQLHTTALGVCMPGPSDFEKGIVLNTPNLTGGWNNFNVKAYLTNHSNVKKIAFENDANVMALGNHYSYGFNHKDITQFFTVSTGLGAGLIINNQIFTGFNHFAQEVACAPLAFFADKTPLGIGSLEYYASGSWMEKQALKKGMKYSTKTLFENYQTNQVAQEIINNGISTLANAFATVMAFLNPNHFVVGGSVAFHHWWYVQKAFELARTRTVKEQYDVAKLLPDKFGDDSALIGLSYFIKNTVSD